MCLWTVNSIHHGLSTKPQIGWKKVIEIMEDQEVAGEYLSKGYYIEALTRSTKPLRIGVWMHEKDYRPEDSDQYLSSMDQDKRYHTGWHIFIDKQTDGEDIPVCVTSNKREVLVKVEYRGIWAIGADAIWDFWRIFVEVPVVVAKYMKIIDRGY